MEVTSSSVDEEREPVVTPDSDFEDELLFVPETDPELLASSVDAHPHPKEVVSEALRCMGGSGKGAGNLSATNKKGRQQHRPKHDVRETRGRRRHDIDADAIEEDDRDDGLPVAWDNTDIYSPDDDSGEYPPQWEHLLRGHPRYEADTKRKLSSSPVEDGMGGNLDAGRSGNHTRGRFDDGYSSGSDDEPELRLRLPILSAPPRPARKSKKEKKTTTMKKREAYVPTTREGRESLLRRKQRIRAIKDKAREVREQQQMVDDLKKDIEREEEEEKKKLWAKRYGCCEPLYMHM